MNLDGSGNQYRYKKVEQELSRHIEAGDLLAGDKLPSLRQMSRSLQVSISTVSHAYEELEKRGLIESRPRSGYYVRSELRRIPTPEIKTVQKPEPHTVTKNKLILTALETVGNRDILPLGVVCPSNELLPTRQLSKIMSSVIRDNPLETAGYETIPGNLDLRRQIAFRSVDCGSDITADDLLITTGAMEALYISLRTLTRPGDLVLIQSPSYYCFLQLVENLGLRAIEVPSCPENGINPDRVAEITRTFDIKACIFAPNFNNPDGSLTSEDRKREIVKNLAERKIPLVEDDVYGDIYFGDSRPGTLKSYDREGGVLLCSSFSKTIAPGYRVGWLAPGRYLEKALEIKATTNVSCVSPTQMAIARYLRESLHDRHLKKLRAAMKEQMDKMRTEIGLSFPEGTKVTNPKGGSVLWVELPEGKDGVDLFFKAREEGIGIVPGIVFSPQDVFSNYIRLSSGAPWSEKIQSGIRRLGELAAM
ncbi:PLP-dependent aminotransferase family protein [Maridesulfovibrio hydrothermalis]|uniref:Transcriptional regulator, GntR family with aminotransferase domain n=1 Tax=Maridesulfovibrio hydrothermalis AM13 = DSM 14728 TaxID=1121451 RepID=L0R9V7_9BACT|nr:PLP-dependent aminotransferase family protein [Maridesulfovibrio hydrothermalis]CCO23534.1 Transcriptional regulator, GntR family with aminotransferase domain [Maridesulfovibrio hydrothermalis AM13 = DSM 14728]